MHYGEGAVNADQLERLDEAAGRVEELRGYL